MPYVSKIVPMLWLLLSVPSLGMDLELIDNGVMRLLVKGHKIDIPCALIQERGGPLLNELRMNPPEVSKMRKIAHKNRIELKCSKSQFDVAYYFIKKQALPTGYFESTAQSAADFFGLDAMKDYIAQHPPAMSGHFVITRAQKCPHCKQKLCGNLDAAEHLIDWHMATIATSYRYKESVYWEMSYQIPTSELLR